MATLSDTGEPRAGYYSSAEWYHGLIMAAPAAMYATDANGIITVYNEAAAQMWGRNPEIGKDMWCGSWRIFRPEDGSEMPLNECPMAITLATGIAVRDQEIIVE